MSSKNFVMTITPLSLLFGRDGEKEAVKINVTELRNIAISTYAFSPNEAKLLVEYLKSMLEIEG